MKIREQEWRSAMSKSAVNEVSSTVGPVIQKKRRPRPDELGQQNERLRSERVEQELKSMPGWRLLPNGWELGMTRRLPGAGVALSFAAYATRYAESMRLKLTASVKGERVMLSLRSPRSNHVTRGVIELARRLG
jgi:pterin-4a-carbinolamine dehydratase